MASWCFSSLLAPDRADLHAAAIVTVMLALYWLWIDHTIHASSRYYLRTALAIVTPVFGALAARFAGTWADTAITVLALVFYATPLFWVALMAILLFSVTVDWLPSFGYETVGANYTGLTHVLDVAAHLGDDADDQAVNRAPAAGQAVGSAPSRNAMCPCGSGKKYKRCHGAPAGG